MKPHSRAVHGFHTGAGKSRLNRKALPITEILASSLDHFPCSGNGRTLKIFRIDSFGDGIGIEQILPALIVQLPDHAAFPGTVGSGYDHEYGHSLRGTSADFPQHLVVVLTLCVGHKTNLELATVRILHEIQPGSAVS